MAIPTRPFQRVSIPNSVSTTKGGLINVLDKADRLIDADISSVARGFTADPDTLCGHPGLAPGLCEVDASITVDSTKTPQQPDFMQGPVFAAYRAVECMPGVLDYEGLATRSLVKNETWAVEKASQQALYVADDYFSAAPTDLTTGSASEGIALMEQWLGQMGGGIIHTTRYGAQHLIADAQVRNYDDFLLYTRQGTPVVNGAGYLNVSPAGVLASSGFYMWATPWLMLYRSGVEYNQGYDLPTNKQTGIAERAYAIVPDCDARASFLVAGA